MSYASNVRTARTDYVASIRSAKADGVISANEIEKIMDTYGRYLDERIKASGVSTQTLFWTPKMLDTEK